jgi:hypothetical protein
MVKISEAYSLLKTDLSSHNSNYVTYQNLNYSVKKIFNLQITEEEVKEILEQNLSAIQLLINLNNQYRKFDQSEIEDFIISKSIQDLFEASSSEDIAKILNENHPTGCYLTPENLAGLNRITDDNHALQLLQWSQFFTLERLSQYATKNSIDFTSWQPELEIKTDEGNPQEGFTQNIPETFFDVFKTNMQDWKNFQKAITSQLSLESNIAEEDLKKIFNYMQNLSKTDNLTVNSLNELHGDKIIPLVNLIIKFLEKLPNTKSVIETIKEYSNVEAYKAWRKFTEKNSINKSMICGGSK